MNIQGKLNFKWKQIMMVMLALSLVLLSACSSSKSTSTADTSSPASSTSASKSSPAATVDPQKDKIMDVSYVNYVSSEVPPPDSVGLKMIQDRFKINIKSQFVPVADYLSKLSVLMASGSIPDVIALQKLDSNFFNWAKQGAFLPLNDYFDKYPSLKLIPKYILDQFTINGKIFAIPKYYPNQYEFVPIIRQDWLDKLNLKVPTSYAELEKVALAFTNDDPDGDGKKDTYGIALSQDINPDYNAGAYWDPNAWYHKNSAGQLIPGIIGPGRKDVIQMFADLYKAGAVTKDFAVLNWAQGNNEFYSGKAGIFIGTPRGMSEPYLNGLLKITPTAKFTSVEPFKAPDGSQGFASQPGFYGMVALSAKLSSDPEKVDRIMKTIDFGSKFFPKADRGPQTPDFDWKLGLVDKGYTMNNGNATSGKASLGLAPYDYLFVNQMWAPSDESNQYSKNYKTPQEQGLTAGLEQMFAKYKDKTFINQANGVQSPTNASKGTELTKYLLGEQTKMIVGQRPITEWDQMVKEWSDKGGDAIIKETNQGIQDRK